MNQNQHLKINGLKKIIQISSKMNRGSKDKALRILSELE